MAVPTLARSLHFRGWRRLHAAVCPLAFEFELPELEREDIRPGF